MTDLGEFLKAAGAQRRSPGVVDCCTFPADWAVACGRPDPMADWRGGYATDDEAHELIAEAGGLAALFAAGMESAGIVPVVGDDFAPGDIAVVSLLGVEGGAIYTGRRWALVGEAGIACASLDREAIVRAWRPTHG